MAYHNSLFRIRTIVLLTCLFLLNQCEKPTPITENNLLSEDSFKNPPIENRPLSLWAWLNGYVDTTKMVYELEQMKEKGMRGAFIWDVGAISDPEKMVPAGPAFLEDESLGYINLALKTGKRLGLDLGLFASSSWNAGGPWVAEADASKELLSVTQTVVGPSKQRLTIGTPKFRRDQPKFYSLISAMAVPHAELNKNNYSPDKTINLDKFIVENKFIDWDMPAGKWDIISFFMCNTGQNLECPSPNSNGLIIDHLSARATKRNFDSMLTKLATVITPESPMKFLELDSYEVWSARDWTPDFLKEFNTRYGYDPKPFLPTLQGYKCKDSIMGERFLGDYNRLVSDMIIDNHFGQTMEIAHRNKMELYSEPATEGMPE